MLLKVSQSSPLATARSNSRSTRCFGALLGRALAPRQTAEPIAALVSSGRVADGVDTHITMLPVRDV